MTSENVKVTAWNEVASKAALDNINRVLTGTTPQSSQTRRQRVIRDSVSTTKSADYTNARQFERVLPASSSNDTAPSTDGKGLDPTTPAVRSPLPRGPALNDTASTPVSQASLEKKFFDARSHVSNSVKPSYANTAALSSKDVNVNITPPHLRLSFLAHPSQNNVSKAEISNARINTNATKPQSERLPSVAPSQKLSKWDLFAQINNFPSGPPSQSVTSYASSTRPTYEDLVAAQSNKPTRDPSLVERDTKPTTTSSKPMNSGMAAKSAKKDAPFPCSYDDCSMGFKDINALRKHKYEDHDGWCKLCDVDTEGYEAFLEHKKESMRHIVCVWCGKDFRSESGRDYHERQAHSPEVKLPCPGCQYIFNSVDSFVNHMIYNQCKKPGGVWCERAFRQNRALAALKYDEYLDSQNKNSFTIDESRAGSEAGDSSVAGGVEVHGSLLDSVDEEDAQESTHESGHPRNIMDDEISSIGEYAEDSDSDVTAGGQSTCNEYPPLGSSQRRGQYGDSSVVKGLESLRLADTNNEPKAAKWSNKLFPDAKPTPAPKGFLTTKRYFEPDRDPKTKKSWISLDPSSGPQMHCDWDFFDFQKDINGHYKCPFESCTDAYPHITQMEIHLLSNMHFGVDYQCPKCFHRFDDDYWHPDSKKRVLHIKKHPLVRLAAHLTSNSVDCAIKRTKRFGHIFHMLTGGYLGVVYDERERAGFRVIEEPSPELPIGDDYDELDRGFRNW